MKKTKIILIGAGDRGTTYATLGAQACPEMEIVAVADPDPIRRNYIRDLFQLSEDACYEYGEDLLKLPKMADAAIIATQDQMHYHLAMQAIAQGYHLLLEKPAAPTPRQCLDIAEAAEARGVTVVVCHVLRYTPFFRLLKNIIDEGRIGKIINIVHVECVGNVHQSHSFVRGNWCKVEDSSPMILAKCCHDLDIVQWLLNEKCTRLHSFGSLSYFRRENMPEGAPEYCYQGCPAESECPYSALRIYRQRTFPSFVKTATKKHEPSDGDIQKTIEETNYGKCVFQCDNNVVDHQVVNMEFESGAMVSFTMSAFTKGGRKIRIMGTKGEIHAEMSSDHITLFDFLTREFEDIYIADAIRDEEITGGHGGGDRGIIRAFCQVMTGTYQGNSLSDVRTYIDNHLLCFAAEESRLSGNMITIDQFKKAVENS